MKRKLLKSLLAIAVLCTGSGSVWAVPTVIKSWDFDAATDALSSQTVPGYSGTTTVNKTGCDNLTGDYLGLALQGAGSWHLYHTNSKGVLQGRGLYNNNGGGRLFALLDLKAGDIVTITANGGLPTSAINGTYDSENSTEGTNCIYSVTADGHFAVSFTRYYYIHTVTVTRDVADLEVPTFSITGANGVQREVTLDCITADAVIKYNTTDDKEADGWTTYSAPFLTSESTLYAYSEKSGNSSAVITVATGAGEAITLNAPTISTNFVENGSVYNPTYTFASNQSGVVIGDPTLSYTYTFNGGAANDGTSYAPASNGSLTVTVSAEGYTSNSTTMSVFGGDFARLYYFDAINDVTVDTDGGTWSNASNVNSAQWTFTGVENCAYTLRSDITISGFMYARATTAKTKQGFYTRTSSGTINFAIEDGEAIAFTTLNGMIVANSAETSQAIGQYTNIRSIAVYAPATEALLAILDCKRYETSAAFATAVAAESFSTAAEVYAFHTAWQMAQAKAAGSVDITKVIRNAAIADGTDWAASNVLSGEQFTGAPDNTYLDIYNTSMNTNQTIYGVPAGTYKIKAATRAATGTPGTLYVNDGSSDIAKISQITNVGNTGGDLGNGWSYQEMKFTLTEPKNLLIGFWTNASGSKWAGCDDWHMEIAGVPVTLGNLGWATLYTPYALNFDGTGLTAYTATLSEGIVTLTKVTDVPANTGVVLSGDAGSYNIPTIASSETAKGNLTGNATEATAFDAVANHTYYVLAPSEDPNFKVQFRPVTDGYIAAGKAFLDVAGAGVKAFSVKFADADAIRSIENESSMFNVESSKVYNLAGQRMSKLQKGINIVNGKKVLVK